MIDWKNKKVAVLGLGVEGLSSVKFLVKKRAKVTVLDRKKEEELEKEIQGLQIYSSSEAPPSGAKSRRGSSRQARTITFRGGKDYLKNLDEFDVIVRSPGIKRNLPEILNAEKNGVEITSQTKIFFDLCPCPIIGVTGTKGKGTTATLVYKMLKEQRFDAYLGGNIGNPPLDFLDKLKPQSWVVLELSSFQLQDLTKSPHIAIVLMITSEHLDYHKDVHEYVDAKRNILRFQKESDFAIINRDYPSSHESDIHTSAKVFRISREREVGEGCFVKDGKVVIRFGSPRPLNDSSRPVGDTQLVNEKVSTSTVAWLSNNGNKGTMKSAFRGEARLANYLKSSPHAKASGAFLEEVMIDVKDILLPGKHNLENVCSAVMAAVLVGVSKENIVKVLKTFKGLEHRLELVAEIKGVRYYDDSFSTTPETAIAAIKSFKNPEILILGGSSKGSDFTELSRVIENAKNIKAIIGIGVEWKRIKAQFKVQSSKFKVIEGLKDMKSVVQKAAGIAEVGDVVILSPACASFDMFKNYKDRGEQFKREVNRLNF